MYNNDAIIIEDPQIGRMYKDTNNTYQNKNHSDYIQEYNHNPEINDAKGMLICNKIMPNFSSRSRFLFPGPLL